MYDLNIYGKNNKYKFVLHLNVNYLNSVILLLSGNVVISCRVTFDELLKTSLTVNTAILYWAPTKKKPKDIKYKKYMLIFNGLLPQIEPT